MGTYKDLFVYKKAFSLAMEIFKISKQFPKEEKFSLTNQIRRSSRSVCTSIGEGYRKRRYPAHFVSKISDSDMENTETQIWLDFAFACEYMTKEIYDPLYSEAEAIGRLLNDIIKFPGKYGAGGVS